MSGNPIAVLRICSEKVTSGDERLVGTGNQSAIDVGGIIGNHYEILSCIGEGGMGRVYRAKVLLTGELVAIKVLFPERAFDEKSIARFQREIRTSTSLDHPHLVKVIGSGVAETGQSYFVTELLEGTTLGEKIAREGQLPIAETLEIFIQVCEGLAHAHAHKILHRDLKPGNMMITQGKDDSLEVKILDFGLAKFADIATKQSLQITQTGELVGSPFYMSPEQSRSSNVDHRSDLYSLGCALYEALTGGPPHVGQSPMSTLLKREIDQPLSLAEGSLGASFPPQIERIVIRLLNRDPDKRFQTAIEVRDALINARHSSGEIVEPISRTNEAVAPSDFASERRNRSKIAPLIPLSVLGLTALSFFLISNSFQPEAHNGMNLQEPANKEDQIVHLDLQAQAAMGTGETLREQGRFGESAQAYKSAIESYRKKFGANTLEEGEAYEELAKTYKSAGDLSGQCDALNNTIRIYSNNKISNQLKIAETMQNLASLYFAKARAGEIALSDSAADLYEHAADLFVHMSPPRKLAAGRCFLQEGKGLGHAGQFKRAVVALSKAETIVDGDNGPGMLLVDIRLWQGLMQRNLRNPKAALSYDREALAILKKIDCKDPSQNYSAYSGLGFDYRFLIESEGVQRFDQARSCHQTALDLCKLSPKDLHGKEFDSELAIAGVYSEGVRLQMGATSYQNAKQHLERAIALARAEPKQNDSHWFTIYQHLGGLEDNRKNFDKAIAYRRRVLQFADNDASLIASAQRQLGETYTLAHQFNEAEETYMQALKSAQRAFGTEDYRYADVLFNMGRNYSMQKRWAESISAYEKAQAIYKQSLGPDCQHLKAIGQALGNLRLKTNASGR